MFSGGWVSSVLQRSAVRFSSISAKAQAELKLGPKYYGQPTHESHPHLIRKGEVVPSITISELRNRRQRLMQKIMESSTKRYKDLHKHIVVVSSASKQYMSDKIPYVFRQNSDFLYLTGCQEPDTCLIITTDTPGNHKSILFVRDKDSHAELWDGPRTSSTDAVEFFGVDEALPFVDLAHYMQNSLKANDSSILWYDFMNPTQPAVNKVMKEYFSHVMTKIWDSPQPFVHHLRLIKSPTEIALMKKSCLIASDAIAETIKLTKPGSTEHEIFAHVDYNCRKGGAEILAYPPVVAGGDRATIIHYINNNQVVQNGDMVLMDAGCEYHGYSSDITRTWPVSGKFNDEQRVLYEIVLVVQRELIEMLNNKPSLDKLFDSMCLLLGKKLQEIGLLSQSCNTEMLIRGAYQFCPHHVSHYLGMDVHDTPSISRSIPVEPGMILTVEPGIYINHNHKVPKNFRGLGVRIEDDILITNSEPVVLTSACPKSIADVEQLALSRIIN